MNTDMPKDARRQVYELTPSDLLSVPVWEFATDEEDVEDQDEATVRPYLKIPVDPADGLQVVRTTFTLADGTQRLGFLSPGPTPGDIRDQQPSIVTDGGHIPLYFGMFPPAGAVLDGLFTVLGKTSAEVFPLTFKTDVEITGGPVEGIVAGFSFLKGNDIVTV